MTSKHFAQFTKRRRRVLPPIPGGAPHNARSSLDRRAWTTSSGVGSSRGGRGGSKRWGRTSADTEHLISARQRVKSGREELRRCAGPVNGYVWRCEATLCSKCGDAFGTCVHPRCRRDPRKSPEGHRDGRRRIAGMLMNRLDKQPAVNPGMETPWGARHHPWHRHAF